MEEGLNVNTAPRRRVQWLDSNYRSSSSHRGREGGSQELLAVVTALPKRTEEGKEGVSRLGPAALPLASAWPARYRSQ